MPQYLPLPDGSFLPVKDGQNPKEVWLKAMEAYPDAFGGGAAPEEAKDKTGFVPALESSWENLKGEAALTAGKLGLTDQDTAQKYYEAKKQRGQELFTPTTESWSQAPFTKFKELVGGSLPQMAAMGLGAAAAPEELGIAGLVGAGKLAQTAVDYPLFVGSNLGRQVDEGRSLRDASLSSAALGAIPQTAFDVVSFNMLPGVSKILGKAGVNLSEKEIIDFTKQGLGKTLASYGTEALKVSGIEGLNEAAQQFFERLQAGLSINDPEARQEYYDNFLGGAVLGGVLAPIGHAVDRSATSSQAKQLARQQATPTQQPGVQAPAAQQPAEEVPEPTLRQPAPEEVAEGPAAPAVLTKQQKAEAARQKKDQEEYLRKYAQQAENRQAAIAEYQRVKDMSPEEYALEQMQGVTTVPKKVRPAAPQEDETGYYTQHPAPPAPHETYAAQQMALAKDREAAPQIKDYLDYLMQDPKQAQALLENRTQIPGVTAKQSEALLGGIKMQLKARADAAAKAEATRVSTAQERARGLFTQKPEDLVSSARAQPNFGKTLEEIQGIRRLGEGAPETETTLPVVTTKNQGRLPIGHPARPARPKPTVTQGKLISERLKSAQEDLGEGAPEAEPHDEMVDKLVQSLPLANGQINPGDVYLGLGQKKQNYKDLQAQLAIARLTGNRALQGEIKRQLDATRPIPTEGGLGTEGGKNAAEIIGRSKLPELRVNEAEADQFASEQRNTLLGMARTLASKKIMLPGKRAELLSNAKEQYVAQHAAEIEARRKAFGLPPMEDWERAEARARALEGLNTLTNNWGQFEDPAISVKALQNITREAVYQNLFKAATRKAQTQQSTLAEKLAPPKTGPRIAAPDELTLRNEPRLATDTKQHALNMITMALREGRTRAVPTTTEKAPARVGSLADMAKLFGQEKGKEASAQTDAATKQFLEQLRDGLETNNDPEFVKLAAEQAQRVVEGNLPDEFAVRDLGEMMKAHEVAGRSATRPGATPEELQRTSAQPQRELFPEAGPEAEVQTQRATPSNFQKMLDSKNIQGLRDAIEKQRKDNLAALQGFGKAAPTLKNKVETAKNTYERNLKKLQKTVAVSNEFDREMQTDIAAATEAQAAWQKQVDDLREREAEVTAMRDALMQEPEDMSILISAPAVLNQEKAIRVALKRAEEGLATAKELTAAVQATNAAQMTLAKPAVDRAVKAEEDFKKAQAELAALQNEAAQKAQADAAAKAREENRQPEAERTAEEKRRAAIQRGREGLGLEGERVQRDVSAIKEDKDDLKRELGSWNNEVNKYTKAVKALKQLEPTETNITKLGNAESKLQIAKENEARVELELAGIESEAPLVRTPIKDRTEADEAFERAQIQQARARNAKENLPSELPSARRGPVVKHVRTGRTEQTGQRKDVVGRADAVTDTLIARRAELAEFKRRVDFLTEKGKPVPQALTNKLNAAQKRTDAAAKIQKEISTQEAAAAKELAKSKKKYGKDELAREAGGEYESAPVTYLRKTTTEAIRDGRMLDVADELAEHGSTQFVKDLAERLRPLLMRTKIGTTQDLMVDGKPAGGAYYPAENRIALDDQNMTEEDLVHEMVHAATMRVLRADNADLTPTQRKARDDLQKLYDQIKEDPAFAKEYAKKDLEEFVAEAMSNSKLQDKLASTKVEGESFFDKLKQFIMRMFGVDTRSDAFKTATDAIDKIFKPSAKLEAKVKARAAPTAKGFEDELGLAERIIADKPSMQQQIDANLGLNFRTKWLDRLAPLEKIAQTMMDPLKGTQMMFFLRMADQKMSFTQQAVANGVPQKVAIKRADGRTEYVIESQKGANLANIAKTLGKAPGMNPAAANRLFTLYLAGKRAERVGADVLNFDVSEQDLKNAVGKIEANKELHDVFEDARNQYNEYNRNLVNFLQDMGVISKETAASLSKSNDYIPYYRDRNGEAELVIGGEGTYRVGSLKDQPQLRELIGGNQKIFDFLTSSVQNTSMIMDMGLRNIATKNAMFELQSLGLASFYGGEASGPNVVQFREDGQDRYVRVDTDAAGIPSNLLVKGMEGIPVNNSALVKAMAMPATLLRRAVTVSPLYSARQIFRDSVAAPLTSGADFTPVIAAIKQIGKMDTKGTLESRGIVGGQVFTGGNEDLTRILGEFQSGKIGLSQLVAKAEAVAMEADALTRRAQYDSYIRQGLSEMEATLMSLESMNFNRKGMSPSVRLASTLIPFFNAQLQSLDVLYRAMTGKMPMNERLDIQGKLYRRGAALAGTAIAYTMLMQDDPLYKNAQPDEKYGNFFVHLPGMKEALRVPVPFEIGYIFKSIPEAIINSMASDAGAEDAYKAFKTIAIQTIPGATSGFMPAGVKPLVENATNHSFFTGRELESKAEQEREAQFRYRDSTSELAKGIGAITGTSPIKLENLIRGYTGTMGIAFTQAINAASPGNGVPEPTKKLSEMPVIGAAFQPEDAGGVVSDMYDHMARAREVQKTYNQLVKEGNGAEARQYLQENVNMLATKTMTGNLQETMGKLKKAEMAIKASSLTPDEKRARLDEIQKMRIQIASNVRGVYEKTTPR